LIAGVHAQDEVLVSFPMT